MSRYVYDARQGNLGLFDPGPLFASPGAPAAVAREPSPMPLLDAAEYAARWREQRGDEIEQEQAIAEAEAAAERARPGYADDDENERGEAVAEANGEPTVTVEESFFFSAVEDAYSANTIGMKGTTRKPFRHDGSLWINTGGMFGGDRAYAKCYRLLPDPDGTAPPYSAHDWRRGPGPDLGAYHGMGVKSGGQPMQLVGPETLFVPGPKAQEALL